MNEETLQIVMNYRLFDDDFANIVFLDKKCIEYVLSIILQDDIQLKKHTCQHHIKNINKRSVTLDIYGLDNQNRYINVEIQSYRDGSSLLRARYHVSIIDTSVTATRTMWKDLKSVLVIFITEKDYLGGGKPIYHLDRTCDDITVDDRTHIIFVNGENTDDTPLGQLMHDFHCVNPDDMHDSVLKERVKYLKEEEKGVKQMSEAVEKYARKKAKEYAKVQVEKYARKKAKEYAKVEIEKYGKEKAKEYAKVEIEKYAKEKERYDREQEKELVIRMSLAGLSLEKISEITRLSIDKVQSILV